MQTATRPEAVKAVDLLERAKSGDAQAEEHLLGWAYVTAQDYYLKKTGFESTLTVADAEDLASNFYIEFARAWPRIRAVYHYTRRMLKNNLRRHLLRARIRRRRELLVSQADMANRYDARMATWGPTHGDWSDAEWLKYRVIRQVISHSDVRTRELVQYRCADPVVSYREIAKSTGSTEAALRMRMARFYESVRRAHALTSATVYRNQKRKT
jgi:DNA-directed RNA polymerase specialized sigma24 family protein